jgi:hypothetical protein
MIIQSDRKPSLLPWPGSLRRVASFGAALLLIAPLLTLAAQKPPIKEPAIPREAMAQEYFGADASWFLNNIPFLEIDDAEIQQIYFYRWKLLRSHIREIGPQGTTILEFLDNVPWARQPYTDLNDSASFHLMEARWMRDPAVVDDLIDHLYTFTGAEPTTGTSQSPSPPPAKRPPS